MFENAKFQTPMQIALSLSRLPVCSCGEKAEAEIIEKDAYHEGVRVVCRKCGKSSETIVYDSYCHAIPVMGEKLKEAFASFNAAKRVQNDETL